MTVIAHQGTPREVTFQQVDVAQALTVTEEVISGGSIDARGATVVSLTSRVLQGDQCQLRVYASNREDFADEALIQTNTMNMTNSPNAASVPDAGYSFYRLKGVVDQAAGGTAAVIAATLVAR